MNFLNVRDGRLNEPIHANQSIKTPHSRVRESDIEKKGNR